MSDNLVDDRFLQWTHGKLQTEFANLRSRFQWLKENMQGLGATHVVDDTVTALENPGIMSVEDRIKDELAKELGRAILNSPFCTITRTKAKHPDNHGLTVWNASVTLFKPKPSGKLSPHL